jgi:hypothetical protein
VWHASVSSRSRILNWQREGLAFAALVGVGDAALGQWTEDAPMAFHLRRRLTPREVALGRIGDVLDIRGTDEAARRIQRIRPFLPPPMAYAPDEALP